jgi:hypothetical protein
MRRPTVQECKQQALGHRLELASRAKKPIFLGFKRVEGDKIRVRKEIKIEATAITVILLREWNKTLSEEGRYNKL